MPTKDPDANKRYCRSHYQRMKSDPVKWRAYISKKSEARRNRKPVEHSALPVEQPVEQRGKPVEQPVEQTKKPVEQDHSLEAYLERSAIMEFDGGQKAGAMRHHLDSLLESCGEMGDRDQVFAEGIRLSNAIPAQEGEALVELAERRNAAAGEALDWWGLD